MTMNQDIQKIIRNILNDVRVELSDEFDRNFERQAFFNEAWQRRSSPTRPGGSILIDTGKLRQSISSRNTDSSITFCSTLPYAAIHNDGGEIKVTARMKRFFWHKYHEATGSFGRKKNGERRNDKRTVQLSTEAEFWKHMLNTEAIIKIRVRSRGREYMKFPSTQLTQMYPTRRIILTVTS